MALRSSWYYYLCQIGVGITESAEYYQYKYLRSTKSSTNKWFAPYLIGTSLSSQLAVLVHVPISCSERGKLVNQGSKKAAP